MKKTSPPNNRLLLSIVCGLLLVLATTSWVVWTLHQSHDYIPPVLPVDKFRVRRATQNDDTVHIVFSTDCSGYQHWQGIALWYSAQFAGQSGPITRIASGCTEDQQASIVEEWSSIDRSGRFRVHFTPHMELNVGKPGGKYPYSNKPGGLHHWLTHARILETFICLVDPDMLLLKPFTVSLTMGLVQTSREGRSGGGKRNQIEFRDSRGIGQVLATTAEGLAPLVSLGHPAGQHFGIGGVWARAGTRAAHNAWTHFDKAAVCGFDGAPCTRTTPAEADSRYSVGPVYLAHKDDWKRVAQQWWAMVPKVASMYTDARGRPQLLAEMYAFTMAVANLTLPWSQVSSFMVSDPKTQSPTEAWNWIEDLVLDSRATQQQQPVGSDVPAAAAASAVGPVCAGASSNTLPALTRDRHSHALPSVLHYCQKYEAAGHVFAKHRMAHDFFRCDGDPLPFNATAIIAESSMLSSDPGANKKGGGSVALRTAFMLCHLTPLVNAALVAYKRDVCSTETHQEGYSQGPRGGY